MSMSDFDTQIQEIRSQVESVHKTQAKVSSTLGKSQEELAELGIDLDMEDAKLADVRRQQAAMTENIAGLIAGLDEVTQGFGAQFTEMRERTTMETIVGWLPFVGSKQAEEMRQTRIRNTDVNGQLQDLMSKSNIIVDILTEQKIVLEDQKAKSSASLDKVLSLREVTINELTGVRKEIDQLDPQIANLEEVISLEDNASERAKLEKELSKLNEAYNTLVNQEQVLTARSQEYEKFTKMYQTFVDSLENQVATQTVLINKLQIDTEERTLLYDALVKSMQTAAQQEVAHQINTIGESVDREASKTMAHIGAATKQKMADMLEMHEENMVFSKELQERKAKADEKFARRFAAVLAKHDKANYGAAANG